MLACAFIVMAAVSALVVWTFEVRLQRWPIVIFGAPTTIRVGDNLTDLQFYSRLTRLGYSMGDSISLDPGEWMQSGSNLRIVLRYSPFIDQGVIDGPITLSLDGDTIKSIRLMRSLQEVKSLDLEPELLGVFPAKGQTPELCIPAKLDQMPPLLLDSVLLTEDNRFYTHNGIDIVSIYRAIISNVQAGRYVQGASTITQQLIRMTLLNPEKTLWRKFTEVILSLGADAIYSKKTILEAYLNRVYLGQAGPLPVLGVYEAARNFFGKSLDQLDASECALVAAIIKAPNILNPFRHPERTLARRNMILGLLLKHGKISRDTYEEEIAKPVQMLRASFSPPRASVFLEMAKQELRYGNSGADNGRNFFSTSLDGAMQAFAETKMRRFGELGLQSHVIIVNPETGSLLVYLTPASEKWDGQGGNLGLFAPIALIPAFTPQRVSDPLYTLASQVTLDVTDPRRTAFTEAFRLNRETLLSRITEVIGPDRIVSALNDFRIRAKVLNGSETFIQPMNPLEVAQSYSALAGLGYTRLINCRRPPLSIDLTRANTPDEIRVSTPAAVIFIVNSLTRDGQNSQELTDNPQKLLLSPSCIVDHDKRGVWGVAYHRNSLALIRIPSAALNPKLVRKTILEILPSPNLGFNKDFSIPSGLVFRKLCAESGLRATSTCPKITLEPFLTGTQPDEWCSLRHEKAQKTENPQKQFIRPR